MFELLIFINIVRAEENLLVGQPAYMPVLSIEMMKKTGDWKYEKGSYGMYCDPGAKCTCEGSFFGTGYYIAASTGQDYGELSVYIDGVFFWTFDQFRDSKNLDHQLIGPYGPDHDGYHTIKLVQVSRKIKIDGVYVRTSDSLAIFSHNHDKAHYQNGWTEDIKLGSHYTDVGGQVFFDFTGNFIMINGTVGPDYGSAMVWIDKVYKGEINCYSAGKTMSAILYMAEVKNGTHQLIMQGTKGKGLGISGFLVRNFYFYKEVNINNFEMSVGWSTNPKEPGHTWTNNDVSYQSVRITQNCTKFDIIAVTDPNHGRMIVNVNNTRVGLVDTYSNPRKMYVDVFSYKLPSNKYLIEIKRERGNNATSNNAIDVYGIWFYNNMGAGLLEFEESKIKVSLGSDVNIRIVRKGGAVGPTGAKIEFHDVSARNGIHYIAKNQTIHFNGGQQTADVVIKTKTISPQNNRECFVFKCNIVNAEHFAIVGESNTTEITLEYFPPTSKFSPSFKFTTSPIFSSSLIFLPSFKFSSSSKFTISSKFSQSSPLASSIKFTASSQFIQSNYFTTSTKFAKTLDFTISSDFIKSKKFSSTGNFIQTLEFLPSEKFSYSMKFSESQDPSNSDVLSKSLEFDESTKFTCSELYSMTSLFIQSNQFSRSFQNAEILEPSIKPSDSIVINTEIILQTKIETTSATQTNNNITSTIQTKNDITSIAPKKGVTTSAIQTKNEIFASRTMIKSKESLAVNHGSNSGDDIPNANIEGHGANSKKNIGIIVGVLLFIVLVVLLILFIFFKRKADNVSMNETEHDMDETNTYEQEEHFYETDTIFSTNNNTGMMMTDSFFTSGNVIVEDTQDTNDFFNDYEEVIVDHMK